MSLVAVTFQIMSIDNMTREFEVHTNKLTKSER